MTPLRRMIDDPSSSTSLLTALREEAEDLHTWNTGAVVAKAISAAAIAPPEAATGVSVKVLVGAMIVSAGLGLVGGAAGHAWLRPATAPIVATAPRPVVAETIAADPAPPIEVAAAPGPAPAPAPARPNPRPSPPASLRDELLLFERAEAALDDHNNAVAEVEFRRYLDRFPQGRLRIEAERGLVHALVNQHKCVEARSLARSPGAVRGCDP